MRPLVTFCLLALLGAIAVFLLSNTAPIALTFLGMQSIALPLAVWLAGALLAGGGTGLWLMILFRLAERRGARRERERLGSASFGPDDFAMVDEGFGSRDFAPAASSYRDAGYQAAGYDAGYGDRGRDYRGDDYSGRDYLDQDYADRDYGDRNYGDRDYPARHDPAKDYREPVDQPRNQPVAPFSSPQDKSRRGGFVGRSPASEPEFEAIELEPPVYDANYRIIQPPAADPEKYSGQYPEKYSGQYSEQNDSGPYPEPYPESYPEHDWQSPGDRPSYTPDKTYSRDETEQASSRSRDFSDPKTSPKTSQKPSQPGFQATAQQKSQPKDDWDIDEDLDW